MSPNLLIAAGAQAAAQGLVRSALLTKLLPFAGAVSLLVGLFGRKGGTEIRPAAGNSPSTSASAKAGKAAVVSAHRKAAHPTRRRGAGTTLNLEASS